MCFLKEIGTNISDFCDIQTCIIVSIVLGQQFAWLFQGQD